MKLKLKIIQAFMITSPPQRVAKKIGKKAWQKYFKFTAVRNPWDLVVSSYWWELNKKVTLEDYFKVVNFRALIDYAKAIGKIKKPKSFEEYVLNLPKVYVNTNYYFNEDNSTIEDFYIRFEHLDRDYKKACKKLGIPYEKLLSLKSKTRKNKKHYSKYYSKKTKAVVADLFRREIEFFKYRF